MRIVTLLLFVTLTGCLLCGGKAAGSSAPHLRHAQSEARRPWEQEQFVADLVVVGESLEVSLTDPRGRRDSWTRTQRRSLIPDCQSFTGPMKTTSVNEPHTEPIYQTWFHLYPAHGAYILSVTSPSNATPAVIIARRPYVSDCSSHDSLLVAAGATARWRVVWGMNESLDSCRTVLTLLTHAPRPSHK